MIFCPVCNKWVKSLKEHRKNKHYQKNGERIVTKFGASLDKGDPWGISRAREALKLFPEKKLKILNAGCGIGIESKEFTNAGHEVTGIDFDPEVLEIAKKNKTQSREILADLTKPLPLKEKFFDAVFSSETIEHLPRVPEFLREVHRVLKDDGIFVLTTDNPAYIRNRISLLFGNSVYLTEYQPHLHLYTPGTMQEFLEQAGFKVFFKKNLGRWFFVSIGNVYLMACGKEKK